MTLSKDQYVVFENGTKEGYLEARWSEKHQAFYTITEDRERLYSTDVRQKVKRQGRQSRKSPMVEIFPISETKKAYVVEAGSNGCVGNANRIEHCEYVAKSICHIKDGRVYAPIWATKNIPNYWR